MAELLSAGVFIEEVPATTQVVGPVSTSNMGIVLWAPEGPTDKATLVTSWDQYTKSFGSFDKRSYGAYSVAAFFSNGGRRAYVVRVTPADAVASQVKIQSLTSSQQIETGDGVAITYSKTASTSVLKDNTGASPIVTGSATVKYRAAGLAVSAQVARKRNGTAALQGLTGVAKYEGRVDTKATLLTTGTTNGKLYVRSVADGRTDITLTIVVAGNNTPLTVVVAGSAITINSATNGGGTATTTATGAVAALAGNTSAAALVTATASGTGADIVTAMVSTPLQGMPVYDSQLDAIIPGTLTLSWTATTTKTIVFTGGDLTTPVATKTNGAGSTLTIDLRSGRFSLTAVGAEIPAGPDNALDMTLAYTPASATVTLTGQATANADSNMGVTGTTLNGGGTTTGALTSPTPGGTQSYINVATGAYQLVFTAGATNIPHTTARVLATYKIEAWVMNPISKGAWGNDLRIQIQGSPNYFTTATQTYSRFTMAVLKKDSVGNYATQETYEDLIFTDPTSPYFFADIVNEFSNLITVVEPGGNEAPGELQGLAQSMVIAAGDDADTSRVISATLVNGPVAKRTVSITYTDSLDVARTITDDGSGNLTGDVDASYVGATANTINYTTGVVDLKTISVAGPLGIKVGTVVTATYRSQPAETVHTESFGDTVKAYTLGTDGTFDTTNWSRSQFTSPSLKADYLGLYALDRVDELMQVIVPDFAGDTTVTGDLLDYADARAAASTGGDRFIILTTPKGSNATEAIDWYRNRLGRASNFAAVYWPWVTVADPLQNNRKLTVPALGHVAGIYARTDVNRNVGKSPGGTIDGQLNFLVGLESIPTQGERDSVYPNKINPLISSPQTGNAVWGVRTIALDTQWKYVNARRLFMFVEKSIYNSTFWIVFENNGPALWTRIKAQVQGFLLGLFNDGYFAGVSPDQAFFVNCDENNNTAATIAAGQVIVDVGIAPNKPSEFVRFRMSQLTVG